MKTFIAFNEDLNSRRQALAQRQRENAAAFRQRADERVNAQKEKNADNVERSSAAHARRKEHEQLKKELRQELQNQRNKE
jgi:hypothetical protein